MSRFLCFDVGGTALKYGILDENFRFLYKNQIPTEAKKIGGAGILKKLIEITGEMRKSNKLDGIGISTAGVVDEKTGIIIHSAPIIPNYIGVNIKGELESKFGLPVAVENDVNCAGIAEYFHGAAVGTQSVLCLTVGTGIGGAYIENGKLLRGFSHCGCEIGYMQLPGGEFQDLASASAMLREAEKRMGKAENSLTGQEVFALAKSGNSDCLAAIDSMCHILGMGIANLCGVLNPEAVVLGGGIMAEWDFLCPKIRQSMDRYLIPRVAQSTKLLPAKNGNDAGMIGAMVLIKNLASQDFNE